MNDIEFFNHFRFNEYYFKETQYRDNSRGIDIHYIGFMKNGNGRLVSDEIKIELKKGDMFYIPKGCKYRSNWFADDYVCFDSIGFIDFPAKAKNGYVLQKINYDNDIFETFLPLSKSKTVSTASIGQLYLLLGKIENVMIEASVKRSDNVIEKMISAMQDDPHLSIIDYAEMVGVSETLLYLYCKEVLGKTPNSVRREILCQKAIVLLETTNLTVEEICDKLHFSSSSYFRKVFFDVTKKTPSRVRKELNTT